MRVDESQLSRWKHAYQVLGVPLAASANSIRQAQRRLVKRWHADLYQVGTQGHTDATHMTVLFNEAYAAIERAPLRYFVEAPSETSPRPQTSPRAIAGQQERINGSENSEHGRNRILGKIHTGMRVRLGPLRRQVLESDLPPLMALALSCKSRAHI